MPPPDERAVRRQKIIEGMRGRDLDQAVADPDLLKAMREEAASPDPDRLVTPDLLRVAEEARRRPSRSAAPGPVLQHRRRDPRPRVPRQ